MRRTVSALLAATLAGAFAGCGEPPPEIAGTYMGDRTVNLMLNTGSLGTTQTVTSTVLQDGRRAALDMEDCAFEMRYDGDGIYVAENVTCLLIVGGNAVTLGPADGTMEASGDGTIYLELSGEAVNGDTGGIGTFSLTYSAFQQ